MASMGALVEMSLAGLMVLLGSTGAAFGCLTAALCFAIATAIRRRVRRNATVELQRDVLSAHALGLPVFDLAVAEIDSAMRIAERTAVLRAGSQKVFLELHPESPSAELDALFAHLPITASRPGGWRKQGVSRMTIAIFGRQAPRRVASVVAGLWAVALVLATFLRATPPQSRAALAASLGVLVAGQVFVLALVLAYRKRTSLVLGEHEITVRSGEVDEVLSFAQVRAIELDDRPLFPSITVALLDGRAARVTPLAREETAAVAREIERRFSRSRQLGREETSVPPVARTDRPRPSDPPADRVPLDPRGALAFLGGSASMSIGVDGLVVRRGKRSTFFAFADLRAVSVTPFSEGVCGSRAEIVLHGEDGRTHEIGTSREPLDVGSLSLRLAQAVRAHHGDAPAGAAQLARGDRTISQWRVQLAAAREPDIPALAFRSSPLEDEHLREILASPRATLEERVGAALALRETSAEIRARIRVEASATEDPRLRNALEVVAADELDEERLDAALARAALR